MRPISSTFSARPGPGPIEARLQRASTSFAAAGRLAAVLPAALLAPLAAPADPVPTVLAAALTTATAAGAWLTSGRGRRVVVVLDVVGLLMIGLLQPELVGVAAAQSGAGLVYIAIQMALIAYVVQLPLRQLALLVPALCGSYLLGSLRMPAPGVAGWTSWLVAVALLALGVRGLLYRAAAGTDRALRSQQDAYRYRALAAGRRADEQARLAVLHDTVASTLLMVGSGTVHRDDAWLKAQVQRDLAVLAGPEPAGPGPDTLGRLLAAVAAEGPLPAQGRIESDVDPAVHGLSDVPPGVLAAVAGAVREALTNVQRHAGGSVAARLAAGPSDGGGFWVLVADAGAGFDPSAGDRGRGLRESVLGRCREAGVRASVRSAPGTGTEIRLDWPGPTGKLGSAGPQPVSEPLQEPGPSRLAQRLRLGVLLVPLTLFCVLEPTVVADHRGLYSSVPTQYAVLAVLAGVVLVAGMLELTGRTGRAARPVLLAIAGVAVLASVDGLLPTGIGSAAHWTLTDTGWVVCVVLSRSRPWVVLAALATGVGLNLVSVLLGAPLTQANAVNLVTLATVIVVIQLAMALSTRMVAGWAEITQQAVQRDAAMATREEVAIRVHADRARHYQELAVRIEPLLQGLSDGTLDPGEAGVQRACALEAARLRRLFAENDDVADPLLHELRAEVEVAERRGVAVHLVLHGQVPDLDLGMRRTVLDPVASMLTAATSRARITVLAGGGEVSVSVLADVPPGAEPSGRPVEVSRIRGEEGLWLNLQVPVPAAGTDPDMWVVRATPPDRSGT